MAKSSARGVWGGTGHLLGTALLEEGGVVYKRFQFNYHACPGVIKLFILDIVHKKGVA